MGLCASAEAHPEDPNAPTQAKQGSASSLSASKSNGGGQSKKSSGKEERQEAEPSASAAFEAQRAALQDSLTSKKLRDDYQMLKKKIGNGASCEVVQARSRATGEMVAVKRLPKTADNRKQFFDEWTIMSRLKHPNILEFIEAFEDHRNYIVVSRMCSGGELFDRIIESRRLTERDASRYTAQILHALAKCHEENVAHRDLKPENLLLADESEDPPIKLIDFGCAVCLSDNETVEDVSGSPYYVAPEVLKRTHVRAKLQLDTGATWRASDMWSVGVIIFLMLHGWPPFNGETQNEIFSGIRSGIFKFSRKVRLSVEARDLIKKLLVMNPRRRLTAKQALEHPWIASNVAPDDPLPQDVFERMGEFRESCKLKKAVARVLAGRMSDVENEELAQLFRKFDENQDGRLDSTEIAAMMRYIGRPETDAQRLIAEFDEDGDEHLDLDEFAVANQVQGMRELDDVKLVFEELDVDGDGRISVDEIRNFCKLDEAAASKLIEEVDQDGDGSIDYEEWIQAMTGLQDASRRQATFDAIAEEVLDE